MVDRAERAECLADSGLVRDVERDPLGVDVGPLRVAADDDDVPAGRRARRAAARPMPDEPPTKTALIRPRP